ncbi:carotenoid cleavage dioxygenase 7, chloroplastic-like [Camellia sinensis]|uniref:carotenoid cleavage dioxygenase 7, chloroplastic-like n=1 Tax=Camellia sinensis TaxID=4442 RepID=UPI001036817E|nr:carotenoid cleavage dioxygenase 7, chloroplastic-like [Camellia sinensis]
MMNRKAENLLPHLVQVSINLDANGECQECSVKSLNEWKKASDFPVINQDYSGAKNTYIYAATTSGSSQALPHFPFDTVLKLNTLNKSIHTWSVGSRRFIGEPIFVPKGTQEEEDNGYILVVEVSTFNFKNQIFHDMKLSVLKISVPNTFQSVAPDFRI